MTCRATLHASTVLCGVFSYVVDLFACPAAKAFDSSIPLTLLHELEMKNALELKRFRGELADSQLRHITSLISRHEEDGVFHRPVIVLPDIFRLAMDFSRRFTHTIGSRSLDIFHVAAASLLDSEGFFSNDHRQLELAGSAGLKPIPLQFDS